jgi:hypothetical protein
MIVCSHQATDRSDGVYLSAMGERKARWRELRRAETALDEWVNGALMWRLLSNLTLLAEVATQRSRRKSNTSILNNPQPYSDLTKVYSVHLFR